MPFTSKRSNDNPLSVKQPEKGEEGSFKFLTRTKPRSGAAIQTQTTVESKPVAKSNLGFRDFLKRSKEAKVDHFEEMTIAMPTGPIPPAASMKRNKKLGMDPTNAKVKKESPMSTKGNRSSKPMAKELKPWQKPRDGTNRKQKAIQEDIVVMSAPSRRKGQPKRLIDDKETPPPPLKRGKPDPPPVTVEEEEKKRREVKTKVHHQQQHHHKEPEVSIAMPKKKKPITLPPPSLSMKTTASNHLQSKDLNLQKTKDISSQRQVPPSSRFHQQRSSSLTKNEPGISIAVPKKRPQRPVAPPPAVVSDDESFSQGGISIAVPKKRPQRPTPPATVTSPSIETNELEHPLPPLASPPHHYQQQQPVGYSTQQQQLSSMPMSANPSNTSVTGGSGHLSTDFHQQYHSGFNGHYPYPSHLQALSGSSPASFSRAETICDDLKTQLMEARNVTGRYRQMIHETRRRHLEEIEDYEHQVMQLRARVNELERERETIANQLVQLKQRSHT